MPDDVLVDPREADEGENGARVAGVDQAAVGWHVRQGRVQRFAPAIACLARGPVCMVRAEASGLAEQVVMYEREGKGATFDRAYAPAIVPEPQPHERTPEQKAEGARTVAANLEGQLRLVRSSVAAMQTAAVAGDVAGWTAAKANADQALKQLAHIAQSAPAAAHDAADVDVKKRLMGADQALADAQLLVAQAPAGPQIAAPALSCADALLAALPPDPPPPTWRNADFQQAADAVETVCTRQMTSSDVAAFRAIVARHDEHPIARRFHRLGDERRRRLLKVLDRDDVRRAARAREVARRADAAHRPSDGAGAAAPAVVDVAPAAPADADLHTTELETATTPATSQTSASGGADEPTALDPAGPREALGAAIAARVPGVTYEGTGRFLLETGAHPIEATVRRVHSGVARVRRDAGGAAVLEIPVGLGDNELAIVVAEQLRALQQRAGAPSSATPSASGLPLPPGVRADMESALGADFSAVRVHQDGQAEAAGALAFTRGTDIHFAPGRYEPDSAPGRQLLGHELAHVAQQAQGRVTATTRINGQAANDDQALEHEADIKGGQAATAAGGGRGVPSLLAKPAAAGPMQAKAAPSPPEVRGIRPMAFAPAEESGSNLDVAADAPIQRQPDEHKLRQHVTFKIQITEPMTGEQFKVAAHLQMFGTVIPSDWHDVKDHYTPADSPVEIDVDVALVRRGRGAANAARGIDTDAAGAVAGATERAKDFDASGSDDKAAVLAEIDRRYAATSGEGAGAKVRPGDAGRGALWRSVRDEVLFQRAYLSHLPDKVKAFFRTSIAGRELTPADYDQLFRIAKKIERLPPGQAADCASKITASTANLDELETTIERYQGEIARREQADQERTAIHNQLVGLEGVYQLYGQYRKALTSGTPADKRFGLPNNNAASLGEQLEQQLKRYGFASIADFASYITRYEQAFEDGAAAITLDLLARYAGKLYSESQCYQDPAVVQDLHHKLGGFRAQYQAVEENTQIETQEATRAGRERDAELRRLPGNGGMPARPPSRAQVEAKQKADAARASAQAQIKDLSKDYPIFAEDDLPADKRIDKVALAQASETQLAGVLQAHIANRQTAVAEARGQLEGNHALVYKMTKLMPAFYAQLGIQPGSIHDQIIQDKLHGDAVDKAVAGVLLAIVAIALTVVSFGAATPAVVAAGASIGAAGLSTYMAYDEYKQYTADHAIADAGFADDPSVVWLVLAIAGAGVDVGAAVGAVGKLAPAARALATAEPLAVDGKLVKFHEAVEALRKQKQIDEKIAAAADKAAAARASYAAAKDQFKADLKLAAGRAGGALGPFTDPTVYRGLVKMAAAKLREGVHSLDAFIAQLKQARVEAQLAEMAPEELVKAKAAWAEAEALAGLVKDPALLEKLLSKVGDAAKLKRLLDVFPAGELEKIIEALKNPEQIVIMLDHIGPESTGKMIRQWIAEGRTDKANRFMERMTAAVPNELAETAGLGAKSIIIDSNTAIALMKDADPALRSTMHQGEMARVAYIKSLPPGTELRMGNVTLGEAQGTLNFKGVPIDGLRDSAAYKKILDKLAGADVGGSKGFADQALVADVFFAKTEPGVVPRFLSADQPVVNKLAAISGIEPNKIGGFRGLVKQYGSAGFPVTIEGRTIVVVPVF